MRRDRRGNPVDGLSDPFSHGMEEPMQTLQVINLVVQVLILLVLVWYAAETRSMRINTANQMRLSALPMVKTIFEHPNGVLLLNEGVGVAAIAQLQGFRYQMGDGTYRCSFAPVHTLSQNDGRRPKISMVLEHTPLAALQPHETVPDPNAIIFDVLSRVVTQEKPLILGLYVMDVLGNSYRSEVWITQAWLMQSTTGIREQPETTRPVLVKTFPTDL
jgi:hypothetical protein